MKKFCLVILTAIFYGAPVFGATTSFQAVEDFLFAQGRANDQESFRSYAEKLKQQFDYICPDTFCEGEYTNLASMNFDCVVETEAGKVSLCAWHFYGSASEVNPTTGSLDYTTQNYTCRFAPMVSVNDFLSFMEKAAMQPAGASGYAGLRDTVIPGRSETLWDVLLNCL